MARETERPSAAWNVPTNGAREIIAAAIDTDGTTGSCTWTTSKSFSSSQRRVRVIVVGFTEMLATEPLKGTDTEEPADVIHSGSWDRAGAWVCANGRTIVTVAEKVEPRSLFQRFVALREGLGMEVIGVGKGESVFSTLVERVRGRSVIVPLLADRDISGSGIEVDLGTRRALVAAGPAALALKLERPLFAACITYENESPTGADVRVRCVGPIAVPADLAPGVNRVEALTQAWISAFAAMMADKPEDWHMMQRVFIDDLDPQRLARARAEHERKNR